jgi:hypothetical protein
MRSRAPRPELWTGVSRGRLGLVPARRASWAPSTPAGNCRGQSDRAVAPGLPGWCVSNCSLISRCASQRPRRRNAMLPAFLPVRIDRLELLQPHSRVAAALASGSGSRAPQPALPARRFHALRCVRCAPIAIARGVRFRALPCSARCAHRGTLDGHARRADAAPRPPARGSRCPRSRNSRATAPRGCIRPSGWPRERVSPWNSSRCSMRCALRLPPAHCANSPVISPSTRTPDRIGPNRREQRADAAQSVAAAGGGWRACSASATNGCGAPTSRFPNPKTSGPV